MHACSLSFIMPVVSQDVVTENSTLFDKLSLPFFNVFSLMHAK